jgi:prepilin-type N-terminal cleavage/methylation domain-containing protein
MMRISSNDKGVTLIELLIVAFMLGLVLMSVYSIYITSQRSSYTQDEMVEVQQNLRIAMDSITRDIRNAGFMTSQMRDASLQWQSMQAAPNPDPYYTQPIESITDDQVNRATLPNLLANTPDVFAACSDCSNAACQCRVHADMLQMNSGSPFAFFAVARITTAQTNITSPFTCVSTSPTDTQSVNNFNPGDQVRIYNPTWHDEETNLSPNFTPRSKGGTGTLFQVMSIGTTTIGATTIQLARYPTVGATDNDPTNTNFRMGDLITKTTATASPYVSTVTYCLGTPNTTDCQVPASLNTVCNNGLSDPTMCLVRITNSPQTTYVVASKISGLQFTYLLDNGTEVSSTNFTADLGSIRAVRVTLTGQPATAENLASGATTTQGKTRTMMSVVQLQNRFLLK